MREAEKDERGMPPHLYKLRIPSLGDPKHGWHAGGWRGRRTWLRLRFADIFVSWLCALPSFKFLYKEIHYKGME